jgi:hypothetical protein
VRQHSLIQRATSTFRKPWFAPNTSRREAITQTSSDGSPVPGSRQQPLQPLEACDPNSKDRPPPEALATRRVSLCDQSSHGRSPGPKLHQQLGELWWVGQRASVHETIGSGPRSLSSAWSGTTGALRLFDRAGAAWLLGKPLPPSVDTSGRHSPYCRRSRRSVTLWERRFETLAG